MPSERPDLDAWVEAARRRPGEYLRRRAILALFAAIARHHTLREQLFLKGGTLMNVRYGSPRTTQDVDFTTTAGREELLSQVRDELDVALRGAVAAIGDPSLLCQVQSWEMRPPQTDFPWPTLRLRIGIAERGSQEATRLSSKMASAVLRVDISLNETVHDSAALSIDDHTIAIRCYSYHELVAEKLRALLQQPIRNRQRGQDVYDISRLVRRQPPTAADREKVLRILVAKAGDRMLEIDSHSLSQERVIESARERYRSLALEVPEDDLDFDRDMNIVVAFYQSLPWRPAT